MKPRLRLSTVIVGGNEQHGNRGPPGLHELALASCSRSCSTATKPSILGMSMSRVIRSGRAGIQCREERASMPLLKLMTVYPASSSSLVMIARMVEL